MFTTNFCTVKLLVNQLKHTKQDGSLEYLANEDNALSNSIPLSLIYFMPRRILGKYATDQADHVYAEGSWLLMKSTVHVASCILYRIMDVVSSLAAEHRKCFSTLCPWRVDPARRRVRISPTAPPTYHAHRMLTNDL